MAFRLCLLLQVEPTQLGPTDRPSRCARTPATTPVGVFIPLGSILLRMYYKYITQVY
jgi:hypothetical protein